MCQFIKSFFVKVMMSIYLCDGKKGLKGCIWMDMRYLIQFQKTFYFRNGFFACC